jgi:hypothetical protein
LREWDSGFIIRINSIVRLIHQSWTRPTQESLKLGHLPVQSSKVSVIPRRQEQEFLPHREAGAGGSGTFEGLSIRINSFLPRTDPPALDLAHLRKSGHLLVKGAKSVTSFPTLTSIASQKMAPKILSKCQTFRARASAFEPIRLSLDRSTSLGLSSPKKGWPLWKIQKIGKSVTSSHCRLQLHRGSWHPRLCACGNNLTFEGISIDQLDFSSDRSNLNSKKIWPRTFPVEKEEERGGVYFGRSVPVYLRRVHSKKKIANYSCPVSFHDHDHYHSLYYLYHLLQQADEFKAKYNIGFTLKGRRNIHRDRSGIHFSLVQTVQVTRPRRQFLLAALGGYGLLGRKW